MRLLIKNYLNVFKKEYLTIEETDKRIREIIKLLDKNAKIETIRRLIEKLTNRETGLVGMVDGDLQIDLKPFEFRDIITVPLHEEKYIKISDRKFIKHIRKYNKLSNDEIIRIAEKELFKCI